MALLVTEATLPPGGAVLVLMVSVVGVCYDPASSLRKRNDVQGKGWLDFSLLGLTNGVARADSEDNVSWARTGGSKG